MTALGQDPRFFCDAMLGGLARWLRAAGYDARFEHHIDDGVLVRRAAEEDRIVLSSDGGIFERNVVKSGDVRALFVPRATPPARPSGARASCYSHMRPVDQLRFVLRSFALEVRESRCMACGGALGEVPKHAVEGIAPPRSFEAFDRFWSCVLCNKLFWHGTHWTRIASALTSVSA